MQGNFVTIGISTGNFFFIDWTSADDYANNRTLISWVAYFYFDQADSQLDDGDASVNGLRWDNPGRVYNYTGDFTSRSLPLASGSFYQDHDANGAASLSVSGSINASGSVSSGSASWALTNYVRTPSKPSTPVLVSRTKITEDANSTATKATIIMTSSSSTPVGGTDAPLISSFTWQYSTNGTDWTAFTPTRTYTGTTTKTCTMTWTGADPEVQYYFRALATNTEGSSAYSSNSAIVTAAPNTPATPTYTRSGTTALVAFKAPTLNGTSISSYTFQRSTSSSFTSPTNITGITSSPYSASLAAGNNYYYRVKAITARGESLYSAGVNVIIPPIPSAPTITTPLVKNVRKVTIDWNDDSTLNGAIVTGHDIYARYSSDGGSTWDTSFALLGSTTSATTYTTADLNIAKTYQFEVRTKTDVGNSAFSDVSSLTVYNSIFISAYGYRYNGTNFNTAIQYAARYTGNSGDSVLVNGVTYTGWKIIENVKRWNGSTFISLTQ